MEPLKKVSGVLYLKAAFAEKGLQIQRNILKQESGSLFYFLL
jgi:hypothetical protein